MDNVLNEVLTSVANEDLKTLQKLYDIQSKDAPSNVILPYANEFYNIDLRTRMIDGPEMLGASKDHKSEVIYFKIDRYHGYMDLANTTCVIEYILPGDKSKIPYLYAVPFYDTSKFIQEGKMIFPWAIGRTATSKNGLLEYAIRFYRIAENDKGQLELVYNLNTLPTTSLVKKSLESDQESMEEEYDTPISKYEFLIQQLIDNKTTWMVM